MREDLARKRLVELVLAEKSWLLTIVGFPSYVKYCARQSSIFYYICSIRHSVSSQGFSAAGVKQGLATT